MSAGELALYTADQVGARFSAALLYAYRVFMTAYLSVRATFFERNESALTILKVVLNQIYFTGWQALPIISILALPAGGMVILQSALQLTLFGNQDMVGQLLIVLIVRELSPIITALVVIARSGTAIASELGNMRVNREIEALESMGINPLSYIVFPRIAGGLVSVLCLAFAFNVVALMGGYFVTRLIHDFNLDFYLSILSKSFTELDLILFLIKNVYCGIIVFAISCYQGLSVKHGSFEVPQVTTKAVLNSIFFVVGFFLFLTILVYLGQFLRMGIL